MSGRRVEVRFGETEVEERIIDGENIRADEVYRVREYRGEEYRERRLSRRENTVGGNTEVEGSPRRELPGIREQSR